MSCQPITQAEGSRAESMFAMSLPRILFASLVMMLIGMILMAVASFIQGQGFLSGGLVILIGPIPIILGSGPESIWLVLLAVALTLVAFFAFLLTRRRIQS